MTDKNHQKGFRLAGATVLLSLAVLRGVFHTQLSGSMDSVFFSLVGAGFALVLVPIERLTSVKGAGFELSLSQPQIAGAIAKSGFRIDSDDLRATLSKFDDVLPIIRGSRVLWIDDNPKVILGARRILRALGVDITFAISSVMAEQKLEADNDFDLIITDIQRAGDTHKITGGEPIHEGVNLVVRFRTLYDDPVKSMRVIFYAAYDRERLVEFTRRAREFSPEAEIANSMFELLPKVLSTLVECRSKPLKAPPEKEPTSLETPTGRAHG